MRERTLSFAFSGALPSQAGEEVREVLTLPFEAEQRETRSVDRADYC